MTDTVIGGRTEHDRHDRTDTARLRRRRARRPTIGPGDAGARFGPTQAIALIMGSIIGVGIFNLPTSLAGYGPITLVSMGLTTIGALVLALLFAALSRRLPADGGPYAYARVAFGNRVGFVNAWSYWITAWSGNAAIAVGWVLYVEQFVNKGHNRLGSIAARPRRPVAAGGHQPLRREEHGIGPGRDDDPQVRRPRLHVDGRPVLHRERQLLPVERER